jgi:hypothetical protein
LAKSDGSGDCNLSAYASIPQGRTLRTHEPDAEGGSFNPFQHREGHALKQTQAYVRHLAIASGSLAELQTQIEIAGRLGYLNQESGEVLKLADEIGRMLAGLRKSLKARARLRVLDPES